MSNTKSSGRKTIDLLLPVFLIGITLVSSGCVATLHFAYAKKSSSNGGTEGGGGTTGGTEGGGGTTGGTEGGGGTTPGTQPQPTSTPPPTIIKGPVGVQTCTGVISAFECNLNVNNIHKTTIKQGGSSVVIGQPAATSSGATPVILYIQGVGYVQITGIQAAGSGQATITYAVLVPVK
jgi:hypothetical protein